MIEGRGAVTDEVMMRTTYPVFRSILDRIGDRWSPLVLLELGRGPVRFNELHRSIEGISRRMLTFTLRNLERDGLVSRTEFPTVPPKVEYAATELAATLHENLMDLALWALRNRGSVLAAQQAYDERRSARTALLSTAT